jgi:hypothetical protein
LAGVVLIASSAALAVLGLVLVRRRIDHRTLTSCHEVGGYLLAVIGTLYAVLLGLVVVDAMSIFQEAHQNAEQEINALTDVVILARRLPEAHRRRIEALATEYADVVVEREWATMDEGRHLPEARRTALELIDTVCSFQPHSEMETTLHDKQVDAAMQLWNCRRLRTELARRGMPPLKWVVLILGGVITIFFTYFFSVENLKLQAVMTALMTVIIALNIYLVEMFGYPYSGDLRVDPSGYRVVREIIAESSSSPARSEP